MSRRRQEDPLAGFTDVATIARGSTATILRARDASAGQEVALKLVEADDGGAPDRAAFDREVRALGAISRHPNVVTLHRAELLADGRAVLVLELCDGSLADRLDEQGPFAVRTVVGIGIALAGALETAHRAGVVHGDVRPHNVLVTRYGEVALADFGVAAVRDAAAAGTALSRLRVAHTAPEVLGGQPLAPAGDVYGLASTLHTLLAGQAPFVTTGEEDAETLRARVLRGPVPTLVVPGVPTELRDLLHRALAADPAERPATPLELAQHLRAIERAAGWGTTACRVGEADGSWRFPLDSGPVTARRGRAAAVTGLPPLRLGAPPLDDAAHAARHERRAAPRLGPWLDRPATDAQAPRDGVPAQDAGAETPADATTTAAAPPPADASSTRPPPPPTDAVPTQQLPPPPTDAAPTDLPPPDDETPAEETPAEETPDDEADADEPADPPATPRWGEVASVPPLERVTFGQPASAPPPEDDATGGRRSGRRRRRGGADRA